MRRLVFGPDERAGYRYQSIRHHRPDIQNKSLLTSKDVSLLPFIFD
jgi:hypothetical protein